MPPQADCLFCKIVAGEIPAGIVRRGPRTVVFRDTDPQAPVHVLVIPTEHYPNAAALAEADAGLLDELVTQGHAAAVSEGVADSGYRIVFNTGRDAHQTVPHVHAHVIGGRAMTWPPG